MVAITGYRTYSTRWPRGHHHGDANGDIDDNTATCSFVAVDTDAGVTGWAVGGGDALASVFPAIEGADPRAVTSLLDRMQRWTFKAGPLGSTAVAIGAFDTALWDIKAKLLGEPLWRLLGAERPVTTGYASAIDHPLVGDDLAQVVARFIDVGLRHVKVKVGRDRGRDLERVALAADLVRSDPWARVMVDANESWSVKEAISRITELDREVGLWWAEEPVDRRDLDGLAQVAAVASCHVATGENLSTIDDHLALLRRSAVDIVNVGTIWGVSHALAVGRQAAAWRRPVSIIGSPGNTFVHVAAALPNHTMFEVQTIDVPSGVSVDVRVEDGAVLAGDTPGCGLEIDPDALAPPAAPSHDAVRRSPAVRPGSAALWPPDGVEYDD